MTHRTRVGIATIVILFTFSIGNCQKWLLAAGPGLDYGTSGGCPEEIGVGVHVLSGYYFSSSSGPGVELGMGITGYQDCNDGDPLIYLSPQIKYRAFIEPEKWVLIFGTGYVTGIFVDQGYSFSLATHYYTNGFFYAGVSQNYSRAFNPKTNAIMPGRSSNWSTQLFVGIFIR